MRVEGTVDGEGGVGPENGVEHVEARAGFRAGPAVPPDDGGRAIVPVDDEGGFAAGWSGGVTGPEPDVREGESGLCRGEGQQDEGRFSLKVENA